LSDGRVFSGDVAYDRHHCYLADGFHQQWLANLERLESELAPGATLHPGHGLPCGLEVLDWQRRYIHTMLDAIGHADREDIAARMRAYLPTEALAFLMELSIEALAPEP
jgi:glyoxylase-like metal-dependent hydrolase (beta-lactamase superfamily II)